MEVSNRGWAPPWPKRLWKTVSSWLVWPFLLMGLVGIWLWWAGYPFWSESGPVIVQGFGCAAATAGWVWWSRGA